MSIKGVFALFGFPDEEDPERIKLEAELEDFLKFDFFERFGGGIGMTRLARAYELMLSEKFELIEG